MLVLIGLGILPLAANLALPTAALAAGHAGASHGMDHGGHPASTSPCAGADHHGAPAADACDHQGGGCHCPQLCQATAVPAAAPRKARIAAHREPPAAPPSTSTTGFPALPWRPPSMPS